MRIAAKQREPAYLGEISVEPGEEAANDAAIVSHAVGAQSQGESIEVRCKDLIKARCYPFHIDLQKLRVRPLLDSTSVFAPNILWRQQDIQHRGVDLRMTHEMLQGGQRNAGAHHIRSKGVPKTMWIGLGDLAAHTMASEKRAKSGRGHRVSASPAFQTDEQRRRVG